MTLDLERFRGGYTALGEKLLKAGADVTFDFTAVGCLTMREPVTQPKLEFRFNTIDSVWSHFSALPTGHHDTRMHAPLPSHLQGANARFLMCIKQIIAMRDLHQPPRPPLSLFNGSWRLLPQEFELGWLESENQNPETFQKLTDSLLQRLEAQLRRR